VVHGVDTGSIVFLCYKVVMVTIIVPLLFIAGRLFTFVTIAGGCQLSYGVPFSLCSTVARVWLIFR